MHPDKTLMLFRKLAYWCSLISQFKVYRAKGAFFGAFVKICRQKTLKYGKNPAHPVFQIANVEDTLDRFECIPLGFSTS